MSIIGGSYNFGVWNAPTSLDSVNHSRNLNVNIATKLNTLQSEKKQGIRQTFGIAPPKFANLDINLITYLNNNNLKTFTGMVRQGWGGGKNG